MALAVFLKTPHAHLASGRTVLARDEVAAVENTIELLHAATAEAERIRTEAQQQAAALGKQARERAVALEREAAARAAVTPALNTAQVLRDVQPALIEIVVEAMARLAAGIDRRHLLSRAIAEVGQLVGQRTFAVLKVAPSDHAHAREAVAQLVRTADLPATLSVRPDPAVAPGDCVLLTDSGKLALGLSQQINGVARAVHALLAEASAGTQAGAVPPANAGHAAQDAQAPALGGAHSAPADTAPAGAFASRAATATVSFAESRP